MSQADYEALAALLTGFVSGTAQSAQLNKVWRQSSIMSAVLAQFIVDLTGQDAIDDGTTVTLLANLKMAVQAQSAAAVGSVRNLSMNIPSASTTATLTADQIIVGTALGGKTFVLSNFNKTINLAATGAGGMDTGSAPSGGVVGIYAIYNPTTGAQALLAVNGNSVVLPSVYGGSNMPTGYVASALVSVRVLNASSQFLPGVQYDRRVWFQTITSASVTSQVASLTALSIAVPASAKVWYGWASINTTASVNAQVNVAADANSTGNQQVAGGVSTTGSGSTNGGALGPVPILTPQTVYWSAFLSSGTFTSAKLFTSGYEF
ncbi:hypothetical protein [Burkholderia ubonensis]|uniref:hypothetical protein n=1 Tax=Burkholderia ubonensis TaxID=101571 RepID=UPI001E5DF2F6|nr:hypothetical protein [Burkholderia ubonensis]